MLRTIVVFAPIIAALVALPILGEKIGIHRIVAIVIGFIGVLIIVKPGTDLFQLKNGRLISIYQYFLV